MDVRKSLYNEIVNDPSMPNFSNFTDLMVYELLLDRSKFVKICNISSTFMDIKCGLPQGSILGSLIFLIYINDIVYVSDIAELIIFADDIKGFFNNKDLDDLTKQANIVLDKSVLWFVFYELPLK